MADFTVSQIAVFDKEKELHYIEKNGEILFTAEEVGRHLGYGNPKESISTLFSRHKSELKLYSRNINLIFGNDSSAMRVFTEEGVYILSMLARTNEAKKFRARVALLLRRIRQETLRRQIEAARQTALAEGFALASSLSPLMLARLGKIRSYRERGFSQREISAVMGLHRRTVRQLEKLLPGFAAGGSVQGAHGATRPNAEDANGLCPSRTRGVPGGASLPAAEDATALASGKREAVKGSGQGARGSVQEARHETR